MNTSTQEAGFSFVEFLAITIVLGMLSGVVLPAVVSYRADSFNSTAATDVRNLGLAVVGVADSNLRSDCTDSTCEVAYHGFSKSACTRLQTAASAGNGSAALVVGCCYGGTKGYLFTSISGNVVEFPLSTGTCASSTLPS